MTLHFSPDFWLSRAGRLDDLVPTGRARLLETEDPDVELPEPADVEPRIEVLHAADLEAAVFVPERYEPNYAYPLLVWLEAGRRSSREWMSLVSRLSTRNYLAVALPCPESETALSRGAVGGVLEEIAETLRVLRRTYHVHSERIYPIGFGGCGSLALGLVLERPEWFGGAVALCGRFPRSKQPLFRFRELNRKPVLLAAGSKDECVPVAEVVRAGRLLHAAGLSVTTRVYDAAHEMTPRMLRDVDRWVMSGLGAVTA